MSEETHFEVQPDTVKLIGNVMHGIAGTYRGFLTVSADGVAPIRIPFAVRVNDFALGRVSPLPLAITFAPETRNEDARKNQWIQIVIVPGTKDLRAVQKL